jgi:hypothetical protein
MAITLMAVAAMANRMMNRDEECCRLKAILPAIKEDKFK